MAGAGPRPNPANAAPPPWIRLAVREVLERAPHYASLSAEDRRTLAQAMVKVSTLAAELIAEEGQAEGEIERRAPSRPPAPLATAQQQPDFGESADRIAGVTRNVLNAVSFPRFVTDLINGVFKAMLDANSQQMHQYLQLLNAVSASAEGFERTQFGLPQVRQWVADHFPEAIEYDRPDPEDNPDPEELQDIKLRLRSGARMPGEAEIRATLGVPPEESIDASNPEQLVPFARRYLARQRQQQLATMVMLGMQRIVIDSGKINAAMRFHIDTRSAASEDKGSEFGVKNRIKAGGSFGVGPWGASAEVENTISYVSTQRTQRTEEMNTDLELNSSVELHFHTDYLPLNQMAAQAQADRIRNSTLNPAADFPDPAAGRNARLQAQLTAEKERRAGIDRAVGEATRPPASPPPPPATPPSATPPARTTPPANTPTNAPANPPANPATPAPANPNAAGRTTPPPTNAPGTNAPATNAPATNAPGTNAPGTNAPGTNAPGTNAPGTNAPGTNAPGTNAPGTNAPGTNAPARNAPATNAPATAGPAGANSGVGATVGSQVGAVAGGAAGTAAGTAIAGAIGGAAGGVPAAVTGPIGGAIGGAVGTAVGSAVGGAVGGAVESAVGDLLKST